MAADKQEYFSMGPQGTWRLLPRMAGCFLSMAQPPQEVPVLLLIVLEFSRPRWVFLIPRRRQMLQSHSVTMDRQALMTAQRLAMPYLPPSLAGLCFLGLTAVPTMQIGRASCRDSA